MALTDKLTAIADAVRVKTGSTDAMTLDAMAEAIVAIEAGGGGVAEPCTINLFDSFGFKIYYSCISSDDNTIISGYIDELNTTELHAYKNHILTMCVPYVSSIDAIGLDCSGVEYIENECNGNLMLVFKLTDEIVNILFSDPFPVAPGN